MRLVQEGKKYGLTIPLTVARGLALAELPFENEESKVGGLSIRHEHHSERRVILRRAKREIEMGVRDFFSLQKWLKAELYCEVPLEVLMGETKPSGKAVRFAKPLGWRFVGIGGKVYVVKDGYLKRLEPPLDCVVVPSAYIRLWAEPSSPSVKASWHLPAHITKREHRVRRLETDGYAKAVARKKKGENSVRVVARKLTPKLALLSEARCPPSLVEEFAAAQDLVVGGAAIVED